MDSVSAVILGAVQGITEFLPISSSGHLILARDFLGLESVYGLSGLSFDAVLQLATSLAILIYFRHEFLRLGRSAVSVVLRKEISSYDTKFLYALVLGTIPAVAIGLLIEDYMATVFRNAYLVGWTLLIGAGLMFLAEMVAQQNTKQNESHNKDISPAKGLWIGFFQALALIPGMSRSGMTIAGGLFLGLKREDAARFGFMLGFPIIFGSGAKKLIELGGNGALADFGTALFLGALTAFVVGMTAIHYLMRYLKNHTLGVFIGYRIVLAIIVFGSLWFV